MTGADPANEQVAQRLAERGRDALVERLRGAYAQAAEAHADVLSIDGDRLETIVQGAADRADGLQWRRTLADLASGELGISLTDALAHPAVARAQELVGAPSYEESLAALGRRPAGHLATERSVNGGSSQAQPQDQSAPASSPRAEAPPRPTVESEKASESDGEEQPPWHSIAQPEMLEGEPDPPAYAEPDPPAYAEPDPLAGERDGPRSAEEADASRQGQDDPAAGEAPQTEPHGDPETRAGEMPEIEPLADPEPAADEAPQTEPPGDPEASAGETPQTEPSADPEPTADAGPQPPPRVAGPSAPPDVDEPRTIIQASPQPWPDPVDPPAGQEPTDDLDATREWTARELADVEGHGNAAGSPTHSLPPQPTHVVPALPPETTAGGHVASAQPGQLVTGHPVDPGWESEEVEGYEDDPGFDDDPSEQQYGLYGRQGEEDRLRVTAVHLGGVANLPREGIELRLSAHGLDIMRSDDEILGRLMWSEIDSIDVPSSRVRRRRNRDRARLVVRTGQGDASFEVPGFSSDELHERITPLVTRFGRR